MHGGRPGARAGRIMGQLHKAMDRTGDSVLHRVRPQSGTERVNSHVRGAPRGPRSAQNGTVRPGMQKALNGIGMAGIPTGPTMQTPMIQNGQLGQPMMQISPQQQIEFMAMMEQQARMMAQMMPGMVPAINPAPLQAGAQQVNGQGRSLFDRVEHGRGRGRGRGRGAPTGSGMWRGGGKMAVVAVADALTETDMQVDNAPTSSMEVEPSSQQNTNSDPFGTMCRYNLKCTNKACPFAHQSPSAAEGTTVDMTDTCSFGAACKNTKCVGRHPSPSQIRAHQSEEQCRFFPYCTNANCAFKHPSMPMCRNGADCNVPHCKFTHSQVACKFNPCLNARCPYKHVEGQRGSYADKVWKADEGTEKPEGQHVSERKFVLDGQEEELIKPEPAVPVEELVT